MSNQGEIEIPANLEAERALLASIALGGLDELLMRIDVKDFRDLGSQLVFRELRLMVENNVPLGDALAASQWFSSKAAKGRATAAGESNLPHLFATIISQRCTAAHAEFYLGVVRKLRVRRGLVYLCVECLRMNDVEEYDPLKTLKWLQGAVDTLWEKTVEVFPEYAEA